MVFIWVNKWTNRTGIDSVVWKSFCAILCTIFIVWVYIRFPMGMTNFPPMLVAVVAVEVF